MNANGPWNAGSLRTKCLFSATVVSQVILALSSGPAISANSQFDEGVKLYNQRKYASAEKTFEAYLTSSPTDANALYYLALTYQQAREFEKARAAYQRVLSVSPRSRAGELARTALRSFPAASGQVNAAVTSAGSKSETEPTAALTSGDYASLPDQAKIYFTGDRQQMFIEAQVNGRPMQMLFDTGAPSICVGKNQLSEIGLRAPEGKAHGLTGGAANGASVAYWVMPADVKVGIISRKSVPICVLDQNQAQPLLGQSFFSDFEYTIDAGSKSISFTKKGRSQAQHASSYSVPFTFRTEGNRIIVNVEVNGRSTPMIFDTGNTSAAVAFANKDQFQKIGSSIPPDARITQSVGVTGVGNVWRFPISRVRLGPIDRSNVEVTVGTESGAEEPLLGQPFVDGWEYTIDRNNSVIHFVRR